MKIGVAHMGPVIFHQERRGTREPSNFHWEKQWKTPSWQDSGRVPYLVELDASGQEVLAPKAGSFLGR